MLPRKKYRFLAVATGILVVTAVLRLVSLQDVPPGLARDETLNADIASFILQGRHALFFREGYGHEPLYHYIGAAIQLLFGDNFLAIRLPSAYIGLLLVAASMTLARRIGKKFNPEIGGLTAGGLTGLFLALNWWPIILSRVGLRPILEPLIIVLAVLAWEKRPYLTGFLLGLATYSYTAARVVLILPFLMLAYIVVFRNGLNVDWDRVKHVLIIGIVGVLVYLPLGLTLRADPSLQERVNQLSGPLNAARAGDLNPLLQSSVTTLGVFTFTGDPLSSYGLPGVPLFGLLMGILFYGGLVISLSLIRRQSIFGLILIWLALGLLPSAAAPDSPSLIRLVGAMPVVYLMPALAITWLYGKVNQASWWNRPVGKYSQGFVFSAVFLVVLMVVNFWPTIDGGIKTWANLPETRQKYQSVWLDISRFLAQSGQVEGDSIVIADSWYEPVKADSLRRDYGRPLMARWVQQGQAVVYPSQEPAYFYIPEFAAPKPLLWETVGIGVPVYRSEGFPSYAVYRLEDSEGILEHQASELFFEPGASEAGLTLLGWETFEDQETADLQLITKWQVVSTLPWETTIFAHIWDSEGQAVAQHDTFDAAPLTLQPGDQILQLQSIHLPDSPGEYQLVIGVYNRESQERWLRPTGEPADAFILSSNWQPETKS